MYDIKRTDDEINETLNKADHCVEHGSAYPGMGYEEGVSDAIRWLVGDASDGPMDEFEIPEDQDAH